MMRVRYTTAHGITSPLSRVTRNSATAEKGRSAVARFLVILAFLSPFFAIGEALASTTPGDTFNSTTNSISSTDKVWSITNTTGWGVTSSAITGPANATFSWQEWCNNPNGDATTFVMRVSQSGARIPSNGIYSLSDGNNLPSSLYPLCSNYTMNDGTTPLTLKGITVYTNASSQFTSLVAAMSTVPQGPSSPPTGTGNTCILSDVSLVRLARGAGFTEADLQTAVAIAITESAAKVSALHYNPPDPGSWDIGLWQINDVAHPSYTRNLLFTSPGYNAQAAKEIRYAAPNNWTPWATYNSGAYNKNMSRAATAVQQAPSGTLGGNSCSDLAGSDLVPDPTDPNATEDTSDCGWTFNVLKVLKCVFIPSAGSAEGYKASLNDIKSKPPVSVVVGSVDFFSTVITTAQARETSGGPVDSVGINTDPAAPVNIHFNPVMVAGDYVQGTNGYGDTTLHTIGITIYYIMEVILGVGFGWYWYKRITGSLGGKE